MRIYGALVVASSLLLGAYGRALAYPTGLPTQSIAPAEPGMSNTSSTSRESMMQDKLETHLQKVDEDQYAWDTYSLSEPTPCIDGTAGEYECKNVDLMGHLRHQDMKSVTLVGNDIWGWTSPDGREFGIVGQSDGTAFVEVKPNGALVYMGRLPSQTGASIWRDIKVVADHAYIAAEAIGHGLQVFDLRRLLPIDPSQPVTFDIPADLTAYVDIGNSHNIIANPETNTIFVAGARDPYYGLPMYDVSEPSNPRYVGNGHTQGYVHDAQCVIYHGPHEKFQGREICFIYGQNHFGVIDVTQRDQPVELSRTTYAGQSYVHQGWLATEDMTHILLDDEADELTDQFTQSGSAADGHTRTFIVDVQDLEKPVVRSVYRSSVEATDHNQYVNGTLAFQSNYAAGLRILDIGSIRQEDAAKGFTEVGYFDCFPEDDYPTWSDGAWSAYPFFKSGYVLLNCIERGVFALKYTGPRD